FWFVVRRSPFWFVLPGSARRTTNVGRRTAPSRLPSRDRRQKGDFVAVADHLVHPRVVGIHRARNRALVLRKLRKLAGELPPDAANRRAGRELACQLRGAGDAAQAGEQPHRHAHARRSACRLARSSSGFAVAPSIQTSPPSKNSRFQIGAICFTRSMAYRFAAYASARCGERVTIATLASPI